MNKIEIKRVAGNVTEWFGKHVAANLFFVIALCAGIAMAVITPPFQECDGWDHYLRAVDVSYGNLFSPLVVFTHDSGEIIAPAYLYKIENGNWYKTDQPAIAYTDENGHYSFGNAEWGVATDRYIIRFT